MGHHILHFESTPLISQTYYNAHDIDQLTKHVQNMLFFSPLVVIYKNDLWAKDCSSPYIIFVKNFSDNLKILFVCRIFQGTRAHSTLHLLLYQLDLGKIGYF